MLEKRYAITRENFMDLLMIDRSLQLWGGLFALSTGVFVVEVALWFLWLAGGISTTTTWLVVHIPMLVLSTTVGTVSFKHRRRWKQERVDLFDRIKNHGETTT